MADNRFAEAVEVVARWHAAHGLHLDVARPLYRLPGPASFAVRELKLRMGPTREEYEAAYDYLMSEP